MKSLKTGIDRFMRFIAGLLTIACAALFATASPAMANEANIGSIEDGVAIATSTIGSSASLRYDAGSTDPGIAFINIANITVSDRANDFVPTKITRATVVGSNHIATLSVASVRIDKGTSSSALTVASQIAANPATTAFTVSEVAAPPEAWV